jgi:uncharacterized repeat protein (TIGR01451 family)
MKKLIKFVSFALAVTLHPALQANAPVTGVMEAYIVEKNEGKEVLRSAENVEPDQLVEYHLTYVNQGASGVNGLTVTGPVPEGTSYVTDTAAADVAAQVTVSIDGGVTFEEEPVVREVVKENGEVAEQIIPVDQYTHIQWKALDELSGEGGKQLYRYRVRIK